MHNIQGCAPSPSPPRIQGDRGNECLGGNALTQNRASSSVADVDTNENEIFHPGFGSMGGGSSNSLGLAPRRSTVEEPGGSRREGIRTTRRKGTEWEDIRLLDHKRLPVKATGQRWEPQEVGTVNWKLSSWEVSKREKEKPFTSASKERSAFSLWFGRRIFFWTHIP